MTDYTPTEWVDEDGSGNGTVVTAQRMNNIEQTIVALVDPSPSASEQAAFAFFNG